MSENNNVWGKHLFRTFALDMSVGEVSLTLVLMDTHITRMTQMPLNESVSHKIRQHHADYNNRPSNDTSFMSAVASTVGHLHCEFVLLLFLQTHRETYHFFSSGVQLV